MNRTCNSYSRLLLANKRSNWAIGSLPQAGSEILANRRDPDPHPHQKPLLYSSRGDSTEMIAGVSKKQGLECVYLPLVARDETTLEVGRQIMAGMGRGWGSATIHICKMTSTRPVARLKTGRNPCAARYNTSNKQSDKYPDNLFIVMRVFWLAEVSLSLVLLD
jgi:hypothetical protein